MFGTAKRNCIEPIRKTHILDFEKPFIIPPKKSGTTSQKSQNASEDTQEDGSNKPREKGSSNQSKSQRTTTKAEEALKKGRAVLTVTKIHVKSNLNSTEVKHKLLQNPSIIMEKSEDWEQTVDTYVQYKDRQTGSIQLKKIDTQHNKWRKNYK